jgi:hypothetical protein
MPQAQSFHICSRVSKLELEMFDIEELLDISLLIVFKLRECKFLQL